MKNENEASLKYWKKNYYQSRILPTEKNIFEKWCSDIQENPMESIKQLSELINEFSKGVGYKIDT